MSCCGCGSVNVAEAEMLFELLQADNDCESLLKKHLTQERFELLKGRKTKQGGTLADCIRSGCENPESSVGIYACDPDAYETFAPVFDEVIKDYHKVEELNHPANVDFGDVTSFANVDLDPTGQFVVSTRVRVGRSHQNYNFPPTLQKAQRLKMEKMSTTALSNLTDELKGTYYPLTNMDADTQRELTQGHFLFNDSDRFLRAAGGYNHWPSGRGIFFNENKSFLVWVNEEDHLRLISMQNGGKLGEVYCRLAKAVTSLESSGLAFAKKPGLGYLTFCPTNLGTALRASVHVKIPRLSKSPNFKQLCARFHLQPRGIHGEHTESAGGVYDISNKRRLGLTEFEAIQEMKDGVIAIIQEEMTLMTGQPGAGSVKPTPSAEGKSADKEGSQKVKED